MENNPVPSTVMIPITVEYEDLFLVIPYYNWGYVGFTGGYITFTTRGPHRIQMMCRAIRRLIPILQDLNTSNKEAILTSKVYNSKIKQIFHPPDVIYLGK